MGLSPKLSQEMHTALLTVLTQQTETPLLQEAGCRCKRGGYSGLGGCGLFLSVSVTSADRGLPDTSKKIGNVGCHMYIHTNMQYSESPVDKNISFHYYVAKQLQAFTFLFKYI